MRAILMAVCLALSLPALSQEEVSSWVGQRIMRIKDYHAEQPQQALEALQELERSRALSDADRGYVVGEVAGLLIQMERAAEAKQLLQEVLTGRPDDYLPALRLMLAQLLLVEGEIEAALPLLESWAAQVEEPRYSELNLLAYGYLQSEQYDKAVPVIERITGFTELVTDQWYELLAFSYVQTGREEDAIVLLDEMIGANPDNARWWRQLGNIFLLLEDYAAGAASLAITAAYEELSLQEARRLASLYSVLGMPADGAKVFKAAIDRNPDLSDYEDRMLLGELLVLAREVDAAIGIFQQASELVMHGEAALKIGQLHLQWERFEQARDALLIAAARDEEQASDQIWYLLAITQINLDNPAAAGDALNRINPDGAYAERAANLLDFMQNQRALTAQ